MASFDWLGETPHPSSWQAPIGQENHLILHFANKPLPFIICNSFTNPKPYKFLPFTISFLFTSLHQNPNLHQFLFISITTTTTTTTSPTYLHLLPLPSPWKPSPRSSSSNLQLQDFIKAITSTTTTFGLEIVSSFVETSPRIIWWYRRQQSFQASHNYSMWVFLLTNTCLIHCIFMYPYHIGLYLQKSCF